MISSSFLCFCPLLPPHSSSSLITTRFQEYTIVIAYYIRQASYKQYQQLFHNPRYFRISLKSKKSSNHCIFIFQHHHQHQAITRTTYHLTSKSASPSSPKAIIKHIISPQNYPQPRRHYHQTSAWHIGILSRRPYHLLSSEDCTPRAFSW